MLLKIKRWRSEFQMKRLLYIAGILVLTVVTFAQELTVSQAVKEAGLEELAVTYNKVKIEKALGDFQYSSYNESELQEIALLVDLGFIEKEDTDEKLDEKLDYMISLFMDQPKNYLGNVSDKSIYEKLYTAWNNSVLYTDEDLVKELEKGLKKGTYTGYNIKRSENNANFDKELALTYGHSDISHAIQLVALLKTEGIEARVQLEPKTSSYTYMKDWGQPREKTANYYVDQSDDNHWIAYAKEYDLKFEFKNIDERNRFNTVIDEYAKKDAADQVGLIVSSWWQPLYHSEEELEGYSLLMDNTKVIDGYEVHIFSLEKASKKIVKSLGKKEATTKKIWVNQAFYNYMLGDYK